MAHSYTSVGTQDVTADSV